jgi:hypothetical protein
MNPQPSSQKPNVSVIRTKASGAASDELSMVRAASALLLALLSAALRPVAPKWRRPALSTNYLW